MEIHYRTKEESKAAQRQEFLNLEKGERFWRFLRLMEAVQELPRKTIKRKNDSQFIISIIRSVQEWSKEIMKFVELASIHEVRMILVGGGAVNFHGYQRHSADVDFWIETSAVNLDRLVLQVRSFVHYNEAIRERRVKRRDLEARDNTYTLIMNRSTSPGIETNGF